MLNKKITVLYTLPLDNWATQEENTYGHWHLAEKLSVEVQDNAKRAFSLCTSMRTERYMKDVSSWDKIHERLPAVFENMERRLLSSVWEFQDN